MTFPPSTTFIRAYQKIEQYRQFCETGKQYNNKSVIYKAVLVMQKGEINTFIFSKSTVKHNSEACEKIKGCYENIGNIRNGGL